MKKTLIILVLVLLTSCSTNTHVNKTIAPMTNDVPDIRPPLMNTNSFSDFQPLYPIYKPLTNN